MNTPNFGSSFRPRVRSRQAAVARKAFNLKTPRSPTGAGASFQPTGRPADAWRRLIFRITGLALKHHRLIVIACVAGVLAGIAITRASVPMYRATATVQILPEPGSLVMLGSGERTSRTRRGRRRGRFIMLPRRALESQLERLQSRTMAEQVADRLKLANAPDFLHPPRSSAWVLLWQRMFPTADRSETVAQRKALALKRLQDGLSIASSRARIDLGERADGTPLTSGSLKTGLVKISFRSTSRQWAQKIANGTATTFIESNAKNREYAVQYARQLLKRQLGRLKSELEESEQKLIDFDTKIETERTAGGTDGARVAMQVLQSALQQARFDLLKYKNLWNQAKAGHGLDLIRPQGDATLTQLEAQRRQLLVAYEANSANYKSAYPKMVTLRTQIDQIDQRIRVASGVAIDALRTRYEAARDRVAWLEKRISAPGTGNASESGEDTERQLLQRDTDSDRELYNRLILRYQSLGLAWTHAMNGISMVDKALLPGRPYTPRLGANLRKCIMIALFAAGIGIAILEAYDDSFAAPNEIETRLGLPVLGTIPKSADSGMMENGKAPTTARAEAYRSLRTALCLSTHDGLPRLLLFTSAVPGEGKSTTALALAVSLTQLGRRVLLIDADLRRPSQHRFLGRDNSVGIANCLASDRFDWEALRATAVQETDLRGLSLIASGPLPPNPAELLAGSKMRALLSCAARDFDAVIVDGPPVIGLADAPLLSSIAAATVYVVAAGQARRGVVEKALKRLLFARARVIGVVLNKDEARAVNDERQALIYYGSRTG